MVPVMDIVGEAGEEALKLKVVVPSDTSIHCIVLLPANAAPVMVTLKEVPGSPLFGERDI